MLIFRSMLFALLILVSGIASIQAVLACDLPKDWKRMEAASSRQVKIQRGISAALRIVSEKIEIGKPFSVDIVVCDKAQKAIDRVTIDASMPAHKHGMNYRPVVKKLNNNSFRGEHMLFHMPGVWRIDFAAFQNGEISRMMLEVDVE